MAKASIYKDIFKTKSIVINEFTAHSDNKPYSLNIFKTFSNPELFDKITLLIENSIKTKGLEFDKLCATSASALPYATNVATSFEKPFCYVLFLQVYLPCRRTTHQHFSIHPILFQPRKCKNIHPKF